MNATVGKTAPRGERVRALLADPEWAGQPVWMLNLLRFKGGHGSDGAASYQKYLQAQQTEEHQRRLVLKGYARTVIGEKDYHQMTIVEYPSPEAFVQMGRSDKYAARNAELRLTALEEQYLIPLKPGFLRLKQPPVPPSRPLTKFDAESVWQIPSGLIGEAAEGASSATSSTRQQAVDFVNDVVIGAESPLVVPGTTSPTTVWHLNLLQFSDRGTSTPGDIYLN